MKLPTLVVVIILSAVGPGFAAASSRLEGCEDPSAIASGLRELEGKDWRAISLPVLQKMWPTEVRALDCHDGEYCTSGWSQDRIIRGVCECCELFNFSALPSDGRSVAEQLDNIVIHYSASTRAEVVTGARAFAAALGMPEAKLTLLGGSDSEDFTWKEEERHVFSGLNVRFSRRGSNWKVYFNFSRYAP
jgi:hypothetical protein